MELQLTGRAATAVEIFVDGGRGGTPKLTAFTVILSGNVGDDAAQVRFLRAIAFLLLTHRNGRLWGVLIAKNQTKVLVCVSRPLLRPILLVLSQGAQHKHAVSRTGILLDDFRRPFRIGELLNGSVRRIAEQVVGAFFDDPTHEAFANKPAVGPEYDGGVGIMLTEEVDDFLIDFLEHGTSILFITHKLNEIMAVADRCTVLRKGKYMGTVDIKDTTKEELSRRMVGRDVQLQVEKQPAHPGETVLDVENVTIHNDQRKKDVVKDVSFKVHAGEIVCLAGIEGNGQTEFIYGLTGLSKLSSGKLTLDGKDITHESIRQRSKDGMGHIPEDRHKHGLVLDFSLENNIVLQRYWQPEFQKGGFIRADKVREYSDRLIEQYDVRSGQGSLTTVRSMSGGNQQKAIIAREIDRDPKLLVAVQPTRGLDVGAIEYIHRQIVAERDKGKAVLLVSLELDEVMNLSDRILVMYEGEIVGEFDPKTTTVQELGLYMAGARKQGKEEQ